MIVWLLVQRRSPEVVFRYQKSMPALFVVSDPVAGIERGRWSPVSVSPMITAYIISGDSLPHPQQSYIHKSLSLHKPSMEQRNTDPSASRSVSSPGFKVFLSCLEPSPKYHILDLGYPLAANVTHLSSWFPGRVYVADLFRAIEAERMLASKDIGLWRALFVRLLDFPADLQFDAIIAWDLFNYLQRDALGALITHLGASSRSGTALFAMIATHKTIPIRPLYCRIADQDRICYATDSAGITDAPRYSAAALEKIMSGFCLQRSFLLSHGVQEYIYRRQ
jgi:hypothetical protein